MTPPPPKRGRPSKLTKAIADRIVEDLAIGMFLEEAAEDAGVDRVTVWRWMQRGERERTGPYAEFRNAVKRANGTAKRHALRDIRLRKPNWQAQAWFLERRFRDTWGRSPRQDVAGAPDGPGEEGRVVVFLPDNGRSAPGEGET